VPSASAKQGTQTKLPMHRFGSYAPHPLACICPDTDLAVAAQKCRKLAMCSSVRGHSPPVSLCKGQALIGGHDSPGAFTYKDDGATRK